MIVHRMSVQWNIRSYTFLVLSCSFITTFRQEVQYANFQSIIIRDHLRDPISGTEKLFYLICRLGSQPAQAITLR